MSKNILLNGKIPPDHVAAIEEHFTVHRLADAANRDKFLAEIGPSIDALVTPGARGFDKALLDALPNVKIVSIWGFGLHASDVDAARARKIAVTNTPDNSKIAVAELGMALLLAASRWIPDGDAFVKSGRWENESYTRQGNGLFGKRCGIVALGDIGSAFAPRAEAFGMTIGYYGPRKKDGVPYAYYNDVKALAQDSDFLVLCCPENDRTRGLITAEVLAALGPDGILVNIARGKIVDEAALIEALEKGTIWAAACDVFADEPRVPERLRKSNRLIAVPHIGSQLEDVRRIRKTNVVANLRAFFDGKPVVGPVYIPEA